MIYEVFTYSDLNGLVSQRFFSEKKAALRYAYYLSVELSLETIVKNHLDCVVCRYHSDGICVL